MAGSRKSPLTVAALDLGSNSFHMLIGRLVGRELRTVDKVREQLSLAAGLDDKDRLTPEAQERALACLERMGQRLRELPRARVRVVGTNTLRRARNARSFRRKAEKHLGHPIEVLSGAEEARLVYLGAVHSRFSARPQLVADIGGGSTEVILGEGFEVLRSTSLFMGCVAYSRRFFPDGSLRKESFRKAEIAARLELEPIRHAIRNMSWETSVGTSGTMHAVHEVLRVNGWAESITPAGLKKLRRTLIEAGSVDRLRLPGLKSERAPVLPGGLAILRAIVKSLGVETMSVSSGALREGVLYDLVGRIRHEDIRDRTIAHMIDRYHVDNDQAERVERTARHLLDQLEHRSNDGDMFPKFLTWASRLHETGLAISHTGYHRHGAYVVANSDMPGFSADDQVTLAALIRTHRRKIPPAVFDEVPADRYETTLQLAVIFRLAALLNRGGASQAVPRIHVDENWDTLTMTFPAGWAESHPLTAADLEQETGYLKALEVELSIVEAPEGHEQAARAAGEA